MSQLLTGYDIREIRIPELDDAELEPIVAGLNVLWSEREPRHIDFSVAEYRTYATGPGSVRHHYVATDKDGESAGFLALTYPDDGTTPRLLRTSIAVLPEHRRKGLATALLRIATDTARDLGREVLSGPYFDTVPAGQSFAEAIGATKTLDFHSNTVRIDDLDLEMLTGWQEQGPLRAPGYSVDIVEGMYPEDILEGMAHLYLVLERDMPQPENWEPRSWNAGFLKEWLGNFLKAVHLLTAIAFEDESGAPVGMSQLGRRHSEPTTWFVTTTMVDPEHRGHALGKWVKAAACLEALERWPAAEWMETGNAFTNEAMLGINHAMGFRHEFTMSEVEIGVEEAEDFLARPV